MSDLLNWYYSYYIRPYVESQPKDDGEQMRFSLFENNLDPDQRVDAQAVLAFYAVQGFRLGLKTGLALGKDLELPAGRSFL